MVDWAIGRAPRLHYVAACSAAIIVIVIGKCRGALHNSPGRAERATFQRDHYHRFIGIHFVYGARCDLRRHRYAFGAALVWTVLAFQQLARPSLGHHSASEGYTYFVVAIRTPHAHTGRGHLLGQYYIGICTYTN
ncbi:unnamed protein product, partial [Iphiclides podalirius]